jgi:hypothetical protein
MWITYDTGSGNLPFDVSGNRVQNNDFGVSSHGPVLTPIDGFIDGGGNICGPGGTLSCGGASSPALRSLLQAPGSQPHRSALFIRGR